MEPDLSEFGLNTNVFCQSGQLVQVVNGDSNFNHERSLRATLRLFHPGNGVTLPYLFSTDIAGNDQHLPLLQAIPNQRVIKWIVAATEGIKDNYVIYWDDTVVEDWMGTGFTAEFKWQPTSEVIEDLYKEDVVDHVSWLEPLLAGLRRGLKKRWVTKRRRSRAAYEEDKDWGSDNVSSFFPSFTLKSLFV